MAEWMTFATPPSRGTRVIVVFYWPQAEDYNMIIKAWYGWSAEEMADEGWGAGTYPVMWMPAPEYPELPEVHG